MEQVLEFLKEKKIFCVLAFFILLSVLFGGLYVSSVTAEESFTCPKIDSIYEEIEAKENQMLIVDIKGAIKNPGVYRVKNGTIVNDVIQMAGGLLENAVTSNLNLGKQITNEMVITVFTNEELKENTKTKEPIVEEESTSSKDLLESALINVNKASLEELKTLPGIGEAKAKLIIEYRTTCGEILKKEELKNIKGIGDAIYEKFEKYITV